MYFSEVETALVLILEFAGFSNITPAAMLLGLLGNGRDGESWSLCVRLMMMVDLLVDKQVISPRKVFFFYFFPFFSENI